MSRARRLAAIPVTIFVVATIVFFVLRVIPGDVVNQLAGVYGTPEQRDQTRAALGLNHSILYQYVLYLNNLVHLDFGHSFVNGQPVSDILVNTVPVTIELVVVAGIMMVVFGIRTGVLAAATRDSASDSALRGVAAVLFSIPWFFAGVLLLIMFTSIWPILPSFGRLPPTTTYNPTTHFVLVDAVIQDRYDLVVPWAEHIILPAAAIGLTAAGFITRITRASMIETMGQDHVRTARAKGVSTTQLYRSHIFSNAALPITTIVGLSIGGLLGGAVVAEVVFSYPGVGKELIDTIAQRDYPVVEGAAIVIAIAYVIINALTDELYTFLDPRIKR